MEIKLKAIDPFDLIGKSITIKEIHASGRHLSIIFTDGTFCLFICNEGEDIEIEPYCAEAVMSWINSSPWYALRVHLITEEEFRVLQDERNKQYQSEREKWERAEYERLRSKFDK